jgi:hypothetical protein
MTQNFKRLPRHATVAQRNSTIVLAILSASASVALLNGCKLQSKSETSNLVGMDGDKAKGMIFSISQDEAEVGMYRLCRGPEGQAYAGYTECLAVIKKYEQSNMPSFENAPAPTAATSNATLLTAESETPPQQEQQPVSLQLATESSATTSTSSGLFLEGEGGSTSVKVDIQEKVVEEVEDPLFTGNHTTPRCWYRYNIEEQFPDLFTRQGRSATFAKSIQLTTYSLKSSDIIQAMKADTNLKKIVLNIKDRDLMVAEKYNERLKGLTSNALWTMFNTTLGAGLGSLKIAPITDFVEGIANKVETPVRKFTDILLKRYSETNVYNPKVGNYLKTNVNGLWNWCFKEERMAAALICSIAVGQAINKLIETGVNASAEFSTKPQMLSEMDEKDIAKATNMIASAKTNIRISNDEFEKLAYVPPRQGESPRKGWFSWLSGSDAKQDIGIIPRLGDKLSNGFLCPNERVAAKIALFRPLEESQYKQIRDEIRAKLPSKVVPSMPADSGSGSADTSSDSLTP